MNLSIIMSKFTHVSNYYIEPENIVKICPSFLVLCLFILFSIYSDTVISYLDWVSFLKTEKKLANIEHILKKHKISPITKIFAILDFFSMIYVDHSR
jgi:hypothetical protein